jgi:hypothetical protein
MAGVSPNPVKRPSRPRSTTGDASGDPRAAVPRRTRRPARPVPGSDRSVPGSDPPIPGSDRPAGDTRASARRTTIGRPTPADRPQRSPAGDRRPASDGRRSPGNRTRHRRRHATALTLLLAAVLLLTVDLVRRATGGDPPAPATGAPPPADAPADPTATGDPSGDAAGLPSTPPTGGGYPASGPGTFAYAPGPGPVLGAAGTQRRFRVAVEDGMGQDPAAFAGSVDQILGDPRGWTASGHLRLQRVAKSASAEFTVFLATPTTSEKLCAAGGLHTDRFSSCRLPGKVVINVARWLDPLPHYGAPMPVYRAYAVNHEVGHQLGFGHETCPGPGRPAPVMQQQTYGLKGCVPNAWPYPRGELYSGRAVP